MYYNISNVHIFYLKWSIKIFNRKTTADYNNFSLFYRYHNVFCSNIIKELVLEIHVSCFAASISVLGDRLANGLYAAIHTKLVLFLGYSYMELPSCPLSFLFSIVYFPSSHIMHYMSKDHSLIVGHTKKYKYKKVHLPWPS